MNVKIKKKDTIEKNNKKNLLQKTIISSMKKGVISLNEDQVKSLNLIFGKKKNLVFALQGIVFTAHKIQKDDNSFEYIVYKKIDSSTKAHDVNFITESQAKSLGLNENIQNIMIGDKIFQIYYITPELLPSSSKNFLDKKNEKQLNDNCFAHSNDFYVSAFSQLPSLFKTFRQYIDYNEFSYTENELLEIINPKAFESKYPLIENDYVELTSLSGKKSVIGSSSKILENSCDVDFNKIHKGQHSCLSLTDLLSFYKVKSKSDINFFYRPTFNNLDSFWDKLKLNYDVNPNKLEEKLSLFNEDSNETVYSKDFNDFKSLETTDKLFADLENHKKALLQKLDDAVQDVKNFEFENANQDLKDNYYYNALLKNKDDINDEINKLNKDLTAYYDKYNDISKQLGDIKIRSCSKFATDKPELINNHQHLLNTKMLDYDYELNNLYFARNDLEKKLIDKLKTLHAFKKEKELFYFEQQKLLCQNNEHEIIAAKKIEEEKKANRLNEIGKIYEGSFLIQKKIIAEQHQLLDYLENLKSFSAIESYKKTSVQALFDSNKKILERKKELDKDLKLAHESLIIKYNYIWTFINELKLSFHKFQQKIDDLFMTKMVNNETFCNSLSKQLNLDLDKISKTNSVDRTILLEQVYAVFLTQIQRLTCEQNSLNKLIQNQRKEWDSVLDAALSEFKQTGFYHDEVIPGFDENNLTDDTFVPSAVFAPTDKIKSIINLDVAAELSDLKIPELLLTPKTKDDNEFLVLSQVFDVLTSEQLIEAEEIKKEKENQLAMEAKLLEKQKVEEDNEIIDVTSDVDNNILNSVIDPVQLDQIKKKEINHLRLSEDLTFWKSDLTRQFKEEILGFAKNIINNKEVSIINTKLIISDTGYSDKSEIYSKKDYFKKPLNKSLSESEDVSHLTKDYINNSFTDDQSNKETINNDLLIDQNVSNIDDSSEAETDTSNTNVFNDEKINDDKSSNENLDFKDIFGDQESTYDKSMFEEDSSASVDENDAIDLTPIIDPDAPTDIDDKDVKNVDNFDNNNNDHYKTSEKVNASMDVDSSDLIDKIVKEQFDSINDSTIKKDFTSKKLADFIEQHNSLSNEEKKKEIEKLIEDYSPDNIGLTSDDFDSDSDSTNNSDSNKDDENNDNSSDADSNDADSNVDTKSKKSFWRKLFKK